MKDSNRNTVILILTGFVVGLVFGHVIEMFLEWAR